MIAIRYLFFIVLVINSNFYFSQQNYFQQEVNYKIDVTLNDVTHDLIAFEKIEYINKSNTSLNFIYFHLWPNAYKNQETALAKEMLESGETAMYFAKQEDLGYIDSLNFLVNGKSIKWEYDPNHIDICKLFLNEPLKSLDTVIISTPFHVKLPSASISRLGHIGQAYAITQWYPKPAVFDRDGWHQMPYSNQGEFYSEFGAFDVNITLPKNYVLAATGDRIDESEEEEWLLNKVVETENMISNKNYSHDNSFPPSSKEYKTICFKQYRVHDFAWFADKRFYVLKGEVYLPKSGNLVNTWAFFTNSEPELWAKSIEYINDATSYYSSLNGDYPYNHVTAIDGTISAGSGMEYPNITIIGESLNAMTFETTIMHEVGHNWFYGILGSNEREYPFLDEGLNSFYEMRYIRSKYPEQTLASYIGKDSTFKFFGLNKLKQKSQYELFYLLTARKNLDQPIETEASKLTRFNYGAIVYSKSALVFDYLMNYLGKEKFDEAMRFYFEQWKFKHPNPTDLIKTLSYYLNTDLHWLENDLLQTNEKLDYKILAHRELEDHSHAVLIKNKSIINSPVSLSGYKNNKLIGTVWYNGFKGKRVFEFPASEIDEFRIDGDNYMPDINRKNNILRTKGLFKKMEPVKFNFIGKIDNPKYTQLNYMPILGYNQYNKFMLGCALYNYSFLQKQTEFTIAPMYAFGSKSIVGFADITQHFKQQNSFFQEITLSAKVKSFSNNYFDSKLFNETYNASSNSFNLNYYKLAETIDFELKKRDPRSNITQHISYTNTNLFIDNVNYNFNKIDESQSTASIKNEVIMINNLQYTLQNNRAINPFKFNFNFQHNDLFGKLSAELNYAITIKRKNTLDIRLFAGTFVYGNTEDIGPYRFRMSGFNGYQDYLFDYNFIGRNESQGIGASQFVENDGAFKTSTYLGQTSKWIVALNIKSPKVGKLPLKLFVDIGTSEYNESLLKDRILFDAGINVCLWKNIFEIYIPVFYSTDIKNNLQAINKSFFDTIRFTLNINYIKPKTLILDSFF